MTVAPDTLRRLAFAKLLFSNALRYARRPTPLNAIAVLMFHDSTELFLQIASEYLNVGKQQLAFMEYFDLLSSKTQQPMTQRESMRRLNKARVALKHSGTMPATTEIDSFRETTTRFFEENTSLIFGVQFSAITLVDLVSSKPVRERLQRAVDAKSSGNLEDALAEVAIAFHKLSGDYEKAKSGFGRSLFDFGPDFRFPMPSFVANRQGVDPAVYHFMEQTRVAINSLQIVCKVLSMGIDYRQFVRFKMHVPPVEEMMDGSQKVYFSNPAAEVTSDDDFDFCVNFVIETALIFAEF